MKTVILIVSIFYVIYRAGCDLKIDKNEVYRQKFLNEYKKELKPSYWIENAQRTLLEKLATHPNLRRAKNVIFFLGDGMSIPTVTASRIYRGQKLGKFGENSRLYFENFPYTGLIKTYCVDKQVPDSACTATAFLCGVKTNFATLGVSPEVSFNDCAASMNKSNHLVSLAYWAQKAGKATGIVTNSRVTHASPAANYANSANRAYECDADVAKRYKKRGFCQDIASQLIFNAPGKYLNVIMGGGRKKFLPNKKKDDSGNFGQRLDKIDLIDVWKRHKQSLNTKYEYVYNKSSLNSINYLKTQYLLGLFSSDHMPFHLDSDHDVHPTLAEMTEAAIKILKKSKNGFYLFVEANHIDLGHHSNNAFKALDETIQLNKAVEVATKLTSQDDTLIVVTADHAHVMTMAGYPRRGENIFSNRNKGNDYNYYATLSYANGPGYKSQQNNSYFKSETFDQNTKFPAMIKLQSETHGGDDVSIYALGPWAHLFTGVYEQNVIPHLINFASCMGNGPNICKNTLF